MSFLHTNKTHVVEIPRLEYDKHIHILHNQYHGCWCPGDARSQGISNYDIDLVKPSWLGPRTVRVDTMLMIFCPFVFILVAKVLLN